MGQGFQDERRQRPFFNDIRCLIAINLLDVALLAAQEILFQLQGFGDAFLQGAAALEMFLGGGEDRRLTGSAAGKQMKLGGLRAEVEGLLQFHQGPRVTLPRQFFSGLAQMVFRLRYRPICHNPRLVRPSKQKMLAVFTSAWAFRSLRRGGAWSMAKSRYRTKRSRDRQGAV